MSKKVNKNNVNAKNNIEMEKENESTPFYYYIIRYGLFLIPCTIILIIGIFLVNMGWNRIKADKQPQAQPTIVEKTEQISDSMDSESVDAPETVSELQESGNLKLSADFAFKLRDLKTKLELDTNLLNDEEKQKLASLMVDFETYLDTLGSKTLDEATNELELLSARVDELNAIVAFRMTESDIYNNYAIEIPEYDEYMQSDDTQSDEFQSDDSDAKIE